MHQVELNDKALEALVADIKLAIRLNKATGQVFLGEKLEAEFEELAPNSQQHILAHLWHHLKDSGQITVNTAVWLKLRKGYPFALVMPCPACIGLVALSASNRQEDPEPDSDPFDKGRVFPYPTNAAGAVRFRRFMRRGARSAFPFVAAAIAASLILGLACSNWRDRRDPYMSAAAIEESMR